MTNGPSPKVIQAIINLLFLSLLFPFVYYLDELIDLIPWR